MPRQNACATDADPKYYNQKTWYVDEQNVSGSASNSNAGNSASRPLRTIREVAERLSLARYDDSFSPYEVHLLSDVSSSAFEWSPQIVPGGVVSTDADSGVTLPILRIIGKITDGATGTLTSVTAQVATSSELVASATALATGDALRFTSGPATSTTRFGIVLDGATGAFSRWRLPAAPVAGNAFAKVSLTRFDAVIVNAGSTQGYIVEVQNCDMRGADFESVGCIIAPVDSLVRKWISPGIGARAKATGGAYVFDALKRCRIQRGFFQGFQTAFINASLNPAAEKGVLLLILCDSFGGQIRATYEGGETDAQLTTVGVVASRFWQAPEVAAVMLRKGGKALFEGFVQGYSSVVGVRGTDLTEGAVIERVAGTSVTLSGVAGEIRMRGGDAIPSIDVNGVPVAGVAITTWAQLDAAPYNGNAMSLVDGTRITTVA